VPSNLARKIAEDLLKYGEVRRGSIGTLRLTALTPELAQQLGLRDTARGVCVFDLGEIAYREGIRQYDVIASFNGQSIEDVSQLLKLVADATIGSTATLGLIRDRRRLELKVPVVQGTPQRRQANY
jgi:S1-C subfamily serine protease